MIDASQALSYNRAVSDELLQAVGPGGPFRSVLAWRDADPLLRDLQWRREPKGTRSWLSLYLGLTSVLDLDERGGRFRLRADLTHRGAGGFVQGWSAWQSRQELAQEWEEVEGYLQRVTEVVERRWTEREGRVHALVANKLQGVDVVNREASLCFRDESLKQDLLEQWGSPLIAAIKASTEESSWWIALHAKRFGTSPDFIALDAAGRLLVIEAKPSTTPGGIVWGPAQVLLYATMWAALVEQDATAVREQLTHELDQRATLGRPPSLGAALSEPPVVVPVLAVGPGLVSPEAWSRMRAVQAALPASPYSSVAPLEVWRLHEDGSSSHWDWSDPDVPDPVPAQGELEQATFQDRARHAAVAWKLTADLPEGARSDGPYRSGTYPFCLPREHARHNLLPEAQGAPEFFAARGIAWHMGVDDGPTTHLVSSQVQCVNALFRMTHDPELIPMAFAELDIAEVLELDGAFLTFEYIGEADYLGEAPGRKRRRGANVTSADAAFRFRNSEGAVEIALVEWKYTEQYAGQELSADRKGVREKRYKEMWDDPDGPLRNDGPLAYEDLFVEPFYQLARQQLLAWKMQQAHEQGAQRVSVVQVVPATNDAYYASLNRPAHLAAGTTVSEVWAKVLRDPATFLAIDSARFADPALPWTSPDYRARYGHS